MSATQTAYSAQSQFTSSAIRALNLDLADVTAAAATATCPTTGNGSPSATTSLSDLQLVNGLVDSRLRNGTFEASVNGGTTWTAVRDLHLTQVPGHSDLHILANGNFLQVQETIGVNQLLGSLGLGGLFSGLTGQVSTKKSNLVLSVTVGPGSTVAGTW